MTLDQKVDALYDLAVEKYKDNAAANIFGLNEVDPDDSEGRTYKEKYWNKESLTSRYNPLNMFLSYHILDRLFASTAKSMALLGCQYGLCQSYGVDFYVVGLFHDKVGESVCYCGQAGRASGWLLYQP